MSDKYAEAAPFLTARLADMQERLDALTRERDELRRELDAVKKDLAARDLFNRTANLHGFKNAPRWDELEESTRQLYRDHAARQEGGEGLKETEAPKA